MSVPINLLKGFARTVATAKPDPKKRVTISDPDTRGLYVRITPKGAKTWTIVARNPEGKQVWREIGPVDDIGLEDARTRAREGVRRIKQGEEAFPAPEPKKGPDSFKIVSERFLRMYVKDKERTLRTASDIERQFKVYIWPVWGDRVFSSIRRNDVVDLIDDIALERGAGMADHVLATLGRLCSWQAARDENYVSPIVRGMKRTRPAERARERVLDEEELRLVWNTATGAFGAFLKMCLLTGQRKAKIAKMKRADISDDGVWTIPTEKREKGNGGRLKLSPLALEVIASQPEIKDNPYVFAGKGKGAFNGYSKARVAFDAALLRARMKSAAEAGEDVAAVQALTHWVIHDLRRTAKSLMARAKVRPDISERVLGHAMPVIEGIYDRYDYFDEKAEALAKLAGLLGLIVAPPARNVVTLARV